MQAGGNSLHPGSKKNSADMAEEPVRAQGFGFLPRLDSAIFSPAMAVEWQEAPEAADMI